MRIGEFGKKGLSRHTKQRMQSVDRRYCGDVLAMRLRETTNIMRRDESAQSVEIEITQNHLVARQAYSYIDRMMIRRFPQ